MIGPGAAQLVLDLGDPQTLARVWTLLKARTDHDEPVDPHMPSVYASAVAGATV